MLKPGMYISDRYEIIDKVGSGGMADVYKAKCHRLNRFVAIKVLKSEYSDDKNFVKKFRGEAQSAAGLSHPNIVNVYDVGDDNGLHYIVMELVEGITLKNFIERKGKLEIKEAVGIGIQIAMGMEAAHLNHIIHRDIKPQNIIISREGKIKVTDFGIAKATNSNTITSNAMGSVHYLSPEQARGGYSDEKSDIYSLGVTLYEMLTGQVPFAGDNTVSVALLHIQGEAIPLREIDNNIPYSIEKIVQKCMQKKPERRYLAASELMLDLRKSISNPNGDFVVMSSNTITDSPTISFSQEEVNTINRVANGYENNQRRYTQAAVGSTVKGVQDASAQGGNGQGRTLNVKPIEPRKTEGTTATSRLGITQELSKIDGVKADSKKNALETEIEEDELDTVNPKLEKMLTIGAIVAGVILVVVAAYFVINLFDLFGNKDKGIIENPAIESTVTPIPTEAVVRLELIEVPYVVGLKLEDAESSLKAKSETLRITYKEDYSEEYEVGFVIEQYPNKGVEIATNGEVTLTISVGKEPIEIPDVYNRTEDQAIQLITEAGFIPEMVYKASDEVETGRVVRTDPERLTVAMKGQVIKLIVSSGPDLIDVVVPSLVNLSQEDANSMLNALGLVKGAISTEFSVTYGAGVVLKQSIASGTQVKQGTAVAMTISLGAQELEPTKAPTVTVAPTKAPVEIEEPDTDVVYEGSITISGGDNPFEYPGEKGIIIIDLEQDGDLVNLLYAEKGYESFPLTIPNITSGSDSIGTISMTVGEYVEEGTEGAVLEGGKYVKFYSYPTSWAINFDKVKN